MKKLLGIFITLALCCSAFAGLSSQWYDLGNFGATVDTLTQNLTVQAGDVIVFTAASNKKESVNTINFTTTAPDAFVDYDAFEVLGGDPNPNSYIAVVTMTTSGSYDFTATAAALKNTAGIWLYHVTGQVGAIEVLDNNAVEWTGSVPYGTAYSVTNSLSMSTTPNDMLVIGAMSTLYGPVTTTDLTIDEDMGGGGKRVTGNTTVSAGTPSYDVVWNIPATNFKGQVDKGSAVVIALAEVLQDPVLSIDSLTIDDTVTTFGETNTVTVSISNAGGDTSNVVSSLDISGGGFAITPINAGPSVLAGGASTNHTFSVITLTNAAFGAHTITGTVTAAGGFAVTNTTGFTVGDSVTLTGAPLSFNTSGPGASDTNTLTIANNTYIPVDVGFVSGASWLIPPAGQTIPPLGSVGFDFVANSTFNGVSNTTVDVAYTNIEVQAGVEEISARLSSGPLVSALGICVSFIADNGYLSNIPTDTYEPGDILQFVVTNQNDSAITVSNVQTSLTADPAAFSITLNVPGSDLYPALVPGQSTTTTYTVEVLPGAAHGTNGFEVFTTLP
jgi:hypothetical protein